MFLMLLRVTYLVSQKQSRQEPLLAWPRVPCMPKEACSLHRILPRALERMASADPQVDQVDANLKDVLREALERDEAPTDEAGNDQDTWYDILLEAIDSKELSHAEINRKRKRLTFAAFKDPTLQSKSTALEVLVEPNVEGMYKFFGRSQAIAQLQRQLCDDVGERQELQRKFLAKMFSATLVLMSSNVVVWSPKFGMRYGDMCAVRT